MIWQQIVTILAVVVGAAISFLGTLTIERHRRRAKRAERWSELQLQAFSRYVANAQRVVAIARTMVLGLPGDEGSRDIRAELEVAHMERAISAEDVRLFGSPAIVEAAYRLNRSVWQLQDFARGEQAWDEELWRQRYESYVERLFEFEKLVRAQLEIPGEIPHPPRPPESFFRKRA
jgi:hypothetical protein